MRDYFASLGQSAHPESTDPRARAITRFQELLLVSFREFAIITDDTIQAERRRLRGEVIHNLETFSKRAAIRNLRTLARFSKEQAGLLYDALYRAMLIAPPPPAVQPPPSLLTTKEGYESRPETRIGLKTFRVFLSEIATWARDEKIVRNGFQVSVTEYIRSDNRLTPSSNVLIVKLQNTNTLTDCSTSGTFRIPEHCHSRLVMW